MTAYILRRLLLMIPTLFGIMAISFIVVQFAPGGPVEQVIAKLSGTAVDAAVRRRFVAAPGGARPAAPCRPRPATHTAHPARRCLEGSLVLMKASARHPVENRLGKNG
mgnify:CR=1 FL=1